MAIKVGINGYGTIGKRVADAVSLQDDMKLVGVVKTKPSYEGKIAVRLGFPLYVANKENMESFKDANIEVKGTIDELLNEVDIIVDCTPGKQKDKTTTGQFYKPIYENAKKKAIFQGGEEHSLTNCSFNALANYENAIDKQFVRVVSCNTTGLCRTLYAIDTNFGIENVKAVMVRRAVDPNDSKKGPVNAIEPVLKVPSHHGPDVQSVMPHINIQTMAVAVPTTLMHLHSVMVKLKNTGKREDVISAFEKTTRIKLFNGKEGFSSTAQIMDFARETGRKRGDLFEIAVWKDGTHVVGNELFYYQAIHQESDVVPENIDCIRAMFGEKDKMKSIEKTNKSLGIK